MTSVPGAAPEPERFGFTHINPDKIYHLLLMKIHDGIVANDIIKIIMIEPTIPICLKIIKI